METTKKEDIKVIYITPKSGYGRERYIRNELKDLQEAVGGHIEVINLRAYDRRIDKDLLLICNEDGKNMGEGRSLVIPGDWIAGPAIICGADGEEFADVPISFYSEWPEIVDRWKKEQ